MRLTNGPRRKAGRQHVLLGKLPHPDRPLDRFTAAIYFESSTIAGYRDEVQVDGGREAAVQREFAFAEVAPALEGAVVEKAQGHRLLDLVSKVARKEDTRDVRLD